MTTTENAIAAVDRALHDFRNAKLQQLRTGSLGEDHTTIANRLTFTIAGLMNLAESQRHLALALRNVYREMDRR
jgi:hypothetical protein